MVWDTRTANSKAKSWGIQGPGEMDSSLQTDREVEVSNEGPAMGQRVTQESSRRHSLDQHTLPVKKRQRPQPVAKVAKPARAYSCPHAGCEFLARFLCHLDRHDRAVHQGLRPYPCPYCEYAAKCKPNLIRHIWRNHECGVCDQTFRHKKDLVAHTRKDHPDLRPRPRTFLCTHDDCNQSFAQKQGLLRHVDMKHLKTDNYRCLVAECDFIAPSDWHLRRHVRTVHEKLRPHACPHCNFTAAEMGNLNQHIRSHGNKRTLLGSPDDTSEGSRDAGS